MEKKTVYKACDRCRSRKRGCDGQQPCTNCKKANPDEANSICIYSPVHKQRTVNPSLRTCGMSFQFRRLQSETSEM
ncbi:hypothetical protein EDD86DRAFT_109549 [Gorgonomyces haynaldii]|nr:hypothetical protein EDD86DRAFT_109549 [Gorgonomyces haynaldii]